MLDISKIEEDAENFLSETRKEYYKNLAGLKDEMNLSAIYEKYKHLFSRALIDEIKKRRLKVKEEAQKEEERRLRYLAGFFIEGYLDNEVKKLTDEIETKEAKATVKIDGKDTAFRFLSVLISNEDARGKRKKIDKARDGVIEKVNVIRKKRIERLHELSTELGYNDYISLFRDVKGIDFDALEVLMKDFLNRTEALYTQKMEEAVKSIGITLKEAKTYDIAYLLRAKGFDKHFPKKKVVSVLKNTLLGLDIDLDKQKNITLDVEARKKKSPRAFTAPIKVPDDVILVIMPHGGQDDYRSMLHEGGHTVHFAYTAKELPFEYRNLGDYSVTETYAFLFDYLPTDKNWLHEFIGEVDKDFLDFVFLNKLFYIRRYAAKLLYELRLHAGDVKEMDKMYKATLEDALKFEHKENRYLMDVDDGFYVSSYLRAWIFEAQLRSLLKDKYGSRWFSDPEAGKFLREMWSHGQKYDVEELAQMVGYHGLDINPLVKEIEENLS